MLCRSLASSAAALPYAEFNPACPGRRPGSEVEGLRGPLAGTFGGDLRPGPLAGAFGRDLRPGGEPHMDAWRCLVKGLGGSLVGVHPDPSTALGFASLRSLACGLPAPGAGTGGQAG